MDIKKYVKKDVEISNDDFDIEGLTNDLRKGVEKDITSKLEKEYEANLEEKTKELTSKYASLQNDFDSLNAKYNDVVNQNKASNLQVAILRNGFRNEDIDEVSKLRTTAYAEITDDNEALGKVKERYGKVFFETKEDLAPNENKMNTTNTIPERKTEITRNTSIKDLMKK